MGFSALGWARSGSGLAGSWGVGVGARVRLETRSGHYDLGSGLVGLGLGDAIIEGSGSSGSETGAKFGIGEELVQSHGLGVKVEFGESRGWTPPGSCPVGGGEPQPRMSSRGGV